MASVAGILIKVVVGVVVNAITRAIFKPDPIQGPRLNDLNVNTNSFGSEIPIIRGSMRAATNTIWAVDLKEVATSSSGGKGGGQKSTTYAYYGDFAVALCKGEVTGVAKIWADSILIYDVSVGGDIETIINSFDLLSAISIYTGSETQLPDSLIESYEGVGNVPAFRGLVYIVFSDLALERFGNRLPNITAEVIEKGAFSGSNFDQFSNPVTREDGSFLYDDGLVSIGVWDTLASGTFTEYKYDLDNALLSKTILSLDGTLAASPASQSNCNNNHNYTAFEHTLGTNRTELWYRSDFQYMLDKTGALGSNACSGTFGYLFVPNGGAYIFAPHADGSINRYQIDAANNLLSNGGIPEKWYYPSDLDTNLSNVYVSDENEIYYYHKKLSGGYNLLKLDLNLNVLVTWTSIPTLFNGNFTVGKQPNTSRNVVVFNTSSGTYSAYFLDDDGTLTLIGTLSLKTNGGAKYLAHGFFSTPSEIFYTSALLSSSSVALSSVVVDVCDGIGLDRTDLNLTELSASTIDGYSTLPSPSRNQIQPLQQAYHFDVVESDFKLKFISRN